MHIRTKYSPKQFRKQFRCRSVALALIVSNQKRAVVSAVLTFFEKV